MILKLKKGDAVKLLDEKSSLLERLKSEGWAEEQEKPAPKAPKSLKGDDVL